MPSQIEPSNPQTHGLLNQPVRTTLTTPSTLQLELKIHAYQGTLNGIVVAGLIEKPRGFALARLASCARSWADGGCRGSGLCVLNRPLLEASGVGDFLRVDRWEPSWLDAVPWKLGPIRAPTDGAKACMRHGWVAVQVCSCASCCWRLDPVHGCIEKRIPRVCRTQSEPAAAFGHISTTHPPHGNLWLSRKSRQCPKNPAYKSANPCLPRHSLVEDEHGCWWRRW